MKLQLLKFFCSSCGSNFDAPALHEWAYGEFLLWSKNARVAYLNAFVDDTYKEVEALLLEVDDFTKASDAQRRETLQRVYGELACDVDTDGDPFNIDSLPPCPHCGSEDVRSWEFPEPTRLIDVDIPAVTHRRWSALTVIERKSLVRRRVAAE